MARFNEWYPNGPMVAPGAISMRKVKNLLKKKGVYTVENVHNIRVNGQLRGCSGFVRLTNGNRYVYFDTEVFSECSGPRDILVRYAKGPEDYVGEINNYTSWAEFGKTIDEMLGNRRGLFRHCS